MESYADRPGFSNTLQFAHTPKPKPPEKMRVYTHAGAAERLGKRDRLRIGNNTWLERRKPPQVAGLATWEYFAIRLHDTDVVEIHADGTYVLSTGGWNTLTTRSRINCTSPASVSTEGGLPYVIVTLKAGRYVPDPSDPGEERWQGGKFRHVPLVDGMRVDRRGRPIGFDYHAARRVDKARKDAAKMSRDYVRGFAASIKEARELPDPGAGDCLICYTFPGDSVDHLVSHFRESYYVPQLLFNAVKERGYGSLAIVWDRFRRDAEVGRGSESIRRDLRAYFLKRRESIAAELLSERGCDRLGRKVQS